MASMSVSGIISGMDWESMIDEIITNAAKPAQPQVSKKTNLTNKKSLFEEMKTTMNSLQSSLSPLKLPSTYKAKTIDIERLDKNGSYKGVLTATVNADAEVNVWDVKVNKLATAQINRSKQITGSSLSSTLSGVSGNTMYVNAGGQKIGIEVKSTDTLESLKSRINTTLKTLDSPIYVTASVVDNKLILKSDYTGLGTMTATETTRYNYSSGINRLSNITIPEAAYDNVKVTSGTKSYTIHKDFEIANGNEIRWRQNDRGDSEHLEVGLSGEAKINYKMAAGDVYTKTGTYDTNEVEISGFDLVDNGTLSSRAKIVDDDGNEYVYGKDFTIKDKKIVWLEPEGPTTNEPDTYTVSYNKTTAGSYSVTGTKINPIDVPESYTVSYDKVHGLSRITSSGTTVDFQHPTSGASGDMPTYVEFQDTYGMSVASAPQRIDFDSSSDDKIEVLESGSVGSYSYVTDFIIRKAGYGSGNPAEWNNHAVIEWRSSNRPSGEYTVRYTHTYSASSSDSSGIEDVITEAGTDTAGITITGSDGTVYTQGTHYDIKDGKIVWKTQSEVIDVTMDQFSELQTKYAEAYSSKHGTSTELTTKTLIDGDGVLRTYVDPDDPSILTITADGESYEYGRDYVLRVNDSGTGYRFQWLVDGGESITDADTVVTTYAEYKNISTQEWKKAPTENTAYSFGFDYNITATDSGTVNKTDTDKSLATVLKNVTVSSSDYSTALTITDGTKTYSYGTDWTIDESGNITWIEKTKGTPTSYTATYANPSITITGSNANARSFNLTTAANGFPKYSDFEALYKNTKGTDVPTVTAAGLTYIADESFFSVSGYTYGEDFVVIKGGGGLVSTVGDYSLVIAWAPDGIVNNYPNKTMSSITTHDNPYTVSMQPISSGEISTDSGKKLSDVLGLTNLSDMSKVTITAGGNVYNYNSTATKASDLAEDEYFLDSGIVVLGSPQEEPKHPAEGVGYTFTYEAFSVGADDTYSSSSTTQEVSIAISDGAGNIGGNAVSYEQILKFASVSSSETDQDKIDSSLSNFFTLTDSSGNSYVYGKDYRVIKGSNTDADTGEYTTAIEWISGGNTPSDTAGITLKFAGTETISTTLKRSAADSAFSPSVALDDLDGGTVTITQGMKTYYEGVDFELGEDDDGNAIVEWISDTDGGYEWFYPEAGTSYTVNYTDKNGNTTSYTGRRTSSDTLDMADLGMTTANGSISFQYGDGLSYKLDAPSQYDDDGNIIPDTDGHAAIRSAYATDITKSGTAFNFRWLTPPMTTHSNLPSMNDEITVEYEYDANTFDLEDDSDGDLLYALGFVKSDKTTYDDYTAAQDAELEVDGETVYRDSNDIGADYDNELIKGVTLHLKGTGEVSLDISHDAEKAVESIQSFVDTYNDLMTWMNTRMTEKQVDEDTAATIDSDDFRMRWGLLHGNSLLRQTKSQMRNLTSQNFTFSFTQRKSSEEIYGSMSFNGLKSSSTLRLRIGSKYVDVTIDPTDTLESIVKKISDDTKGGAMNDIYYDDQGNKLGSPLLKAYVENDKLVIQSGSNDEITMSGSAAMNALKMNYTYKGLYQIGIESTSDDYGKSGELTFDANEFMEALEDNPDEVQALMLKFVGEFDTWTKGMLNSSASGETSGTLTREIENIQSQIDRINEYLENYQDRLDRMEESLRTRYANTETQFSKLSQQANSISAILNQLNGTATGGGYGQTSS